MTILVKDIVGSETAIAYDDGVKCLDLVLESLEKDGSVELDFQGVEFVITAFLNPVIGDLII
ncbi:MAG: STAS-like domain-containing protein, partial [Phascolarctobacterium sp.]|nr:STAS-like domain-containing protein [Phascolarctobacterium sp.]